MAEFRAPPVNIRILEACNFHCTGCCTCSPGVRQIVENDLPAVLRHLRDLCRSVDALSLLSIQGGEPFLLPVPVINRWVDSCLDVVAECGLPKVHTQLVTNGHALFRRPELVKDLTGRLTWLSVSQHPENLRDGGLEGFHRNLAQIAALRPDLQVVTSRAPTFSLFELPYAGPRPEPAPCNMGQGAGQCWNLSPDGLAKCDAGSPQVVARSPSRSPEALEASRRLVRSPITPDAVRQLYEDRELCRWCTGGVNRVPHACHWSDSDQYALYGIAVRTAPDDSRSSP